MIAVQRALAFVVLPIVFGYVIGACCTGCGGMLTPADEASVAQDSVQLVACTGSAHLCKVGGFDGGLAECWREYDVCMSAHGFRDGGK